MANLRAPALRAASPQRGALPQGHPKEGIILAHDASVAEQAAQQGKAAPLETLGKRCRAFRGSALWPRASLSRTLALRGTCVSPTRHQRPHLLATALALVCEAALLALEHGLAAGEHPRDGVRERARRPRGDARRGLGAERRAPRHGQRRLRARRGVARRRPLCSRARPLRTSYYLYSKSPAAPTVQAAENAERREVVPVRKKSFDPGF